MTRTQSTPADEPDVVVNEVRLVGRVSSDPVVRTLPSGDEIVTVNLVVRRPATRRRPGGVDTIECVAWTSRTRAKLERLRAGVHVEVTGSLRRRFTRSSGRPTSWTSVEVEACRRWSPRTA